MNTRRSTVVRIVLEAVAEILENVPIESLSPDLSLRGDLGFDSVMLMRLKFALEQRLPAAGPLVLREVLENPVTPGDVADMLCGMLTRAPGIR